MVQAWYLLQAEAQCRIWAKHLTLILPQIQLGSHPDS